MFFKLNFRCVLSANHPISGFDVVLSNLLDPHPLEHTFELFSEFVRILKPNGKIIGREREDCNADRTQSNLRLAGFVNISGKTDSSQYFSADKPAFEIGASSKLSFGKPAVWSLSNNLVDDDIELVDEDDLLDDDDLLKPNAESLKGKLWILRLDIELFINQLFSLWHNW